MQKAARPVVSEGYLFALWFWMATTVLFALLSGVFFVNWRNSVLRMRMADRNYSQLSDCFESLHTQYTAEALRHREEIEALKMQTIRSSTYEEAIAAQDILDKIKRETT